MIHAVCIFLGEFGWRWYAMALSDAGLDRVSKVIDNDHTIRALEIWGYGTRWTWQRERLGWEL